MDILPKRKQNEKDFGNWEELSNDGRKYWFDVQGRAGGRARYIKEVDREEITISFRQEIYNSKGKMVEIHEKFPIDKGHKKIV